MKLRYIIAIILVALITVVAFAYIHINKNTHLVKTAKHEAKNPSPLPKEYIVTLTKNGFSPKEVTIKVGDAVRWKNESGDKQTVNSDNYPTNKLHKELNFGIVANGSSVVYIFKTPGTYGYHNQFHHEQEGKIIVTQ